MKRLHDILADETRPHIILAHVRKQQMDIEYILRITPNHDPDYHAASAEMMEELANCFCFTLILTGFAQKLGFKLNAARRERGLEYYEAHFCEAGRFGVLLANRIRFPTKGIVSEYNDIVYAEEPEAVEAA